MGCHSLLQGILPTTNFPSQIIINLSDNSSFHLLRLYWSFCKDKEKCKKMTFCGEEAHGLKWQTPRSKSQLPVYQSMDSAGYLISPHFPLILSHETWQIRNVEGSRIRNWWPDDVVRSLGERCKPSLMPGFVTLGGKGCSDKDQRMVTNVVPKRKRHWMWASQGA